MVMNEASSQWFARPIRRQEGKLIASGSPIAISYSLMVFASFDRRELQCTFRQPYRRLLSSKIVSEYVPLL